VNSGVQSGITLRGLFHSTWIRRQHLRSRHKSTSP
jgi:hypothetical protein